MDAGLTDNAAEARAWVLLGSWACRWCGKLHDQVRRLSGHEERCSRRPIEWRHVRTVRESQR